MNPADIIYTALLLTLATALTLWARRQWTPHGR